MSAPASKDPLGRAAKDAKKKKLAKKTRGASPDDWVATDSSTKLHGAKAANVS